MPELLGSREIGLSSAGVNTNQFFDHKAPAYERVCSRLYMYHVILRPVSKKTRTAVATPHLVGSPHFIIASMFYTQSVVRGPQSVVCILQSIFYTDRVNRHKRFLFRRHARRRAIITKIRIIFLFTNTTLNRLDFGGAATGHFTSERMKRRTCFWCTRGILWELKLFFYVNTFVGGSFIICTKESSFDLFSRIHPWFWSKRRGYSILEHKWNFRCVYIPLELIGYYNLT